MQTTALLLPALLVSIASLMGGELVAAPAPAPPDLTKGERDLTEKRTYHLGPTRLRGWIYTKPANYFESQQRRTTNRTRVAWVEDAIAYIEAVKEQPELRSIDK